MKLPHLPRLMLTHADFPEQDWRKWEAARFNHPGLGKTVDTGYLNVMPCCIHCATWICSGCWDWRRSRATRAVSQYCRNCGSREGFFVAIRHLKPHEALPQVPFRVPRMISDDEARADRTKGFEEKYWQTYKGPGRPIDASLLACPAGDPCPATGCPACCPDYDPCGEKNCRNCNPKEGTMHVPEEANMAKELGEGQSEDGALASGMPVSQDHEDLYKVQQPQMVEVLLAKIRHARENNRQMVSLNIEQAEELLAIERRDQERAKKLLKETALHHALEVYKANGNIPGGSNPDFIGESLVKMADKICEWLSKN